MKVILLGATGMVGQGVLRECLLDDHRAARASHARLARDSGATSSVPTR